MQKFEWIMIAAAAAGAVAVGSYPEAAAILLLYAGCKLLEKRLVSRGLEEIEQKTLKQADNGWRFEEAAARPMRLERFLTKFRMIFTPAMAAAAVLVAVVPSVMTGDRDYWVRVGCTFLIIGCIGTLCASVSLAGRSGIAVASVRGILFKSGEAMEKISNMKLLAMGKNGVLTDGEFGLQRVIPMIAFDEGSDEEHDGEAESEKELILRLCAETAAGTSLSVAEGLVRAAETWKLRLEHPEEVRETPGEGVCAKLPEGEVCIGTREFLQKNGIQTTEPERVYGQQIPVALDGEQIGTVILADRLTGGAEDLIKEMRHIGVRTVVITSDSEWNANAVAKQIQIHFVEADKRTMAEKLEALKAVRKKHGDTCYIGTGREDAPLMEAANVSGVLSGGSQEAVQAADILYTGTELKPVEESIDLAFAATRIASENVFISVLIIAGMIFLGLIGYGNLWMALVADILVAVICIINAARLLYFGKYRFRKSAQAD